jgi:hypothetical protein
MSYTVLRPEKKWMAHALRKLNNDAACLCCHRLRILRDKILGRRRRQELPCSSMPLADGKYRWREPRHNPGDRVFQTKSLLILQSKKTPKVA